MILSKPRSRDRSTHLADIFSHVIDTLSSSTDEVLQRLSEALDEVRLFKEVLDAKTIAVLERLRAALKRAVFDQVKDVNSIHNLESAVSNCIDSALSSRSRSICFTLKGGDTLALECVSPELSFITLLNNFTLHISEFGTYRFKAKYVTISEDRVSLIADHGHHLPTYEVTRSCFNNSVEVETEWFYEYRRTAPLHHPDLVMTLQSSSLIVFESSLLEIIKLD